MRYVNQERDRMKLRQYSEEHDRGKVCSPSPRMKALLAENIILRRANSVLRQKSADHGLITDVLILSTAELSVSGLDWELLGLGPDHTGLLRLLPPSSSSQASVNGRSAPPTSDTPGEGSAEHSFIRPLEEAPAVSSTESSHGGHSVGGLFDDPPSDVPARKRRCLRLGRPSVDLKRKSAPAVATLKDRSGLKKPRPSEMSSTGTSPPPKNSRSLPGSALDSGDDDDSMEVDLDASSPAAPDEETQSGSAPDQSLLIRLRLRNPRRNPRFDVVEPSRKKASNPFSSPVVSYFPRKDRRPRRSTSVASEMRMRERLEKELAGDGFMLGLTAENSVAEDMDSAQSREGSHSPVSPTGAVTEDPADGSAGEGRDTSIGEVAVVEAPVKAGAPVDGTPAPESSFGEVSGSGSAHAPTSLLPAPKPSSAVPISQLLNDADVDLVDLDVSDNPAKDAEADAVGDGGGTEPSVSHPESDAAVTSIPVTPVSPVPGSEVSAGVAAVPARTRARSQRATRRRTHVVTVTVTARRGTDTSAFAPAATVVSRAANSRKLMSTAERFLESGFTAVGAQKALCQMLNVSISESAPKDYASPLDFAIMHNVHSARHPWRMLFDRMPDEPLTFELGKLVQGVQISIRASGHGSSECGLLLRGQREDRPLCHIMGTPPLAPNFKEDSDPFDPFTHVIPGFWQNLNRMRNNRADLMRQKIDRLWE
ncbi:hypothetical protein PHMEG_00026724 [Phytophthora megakarya]|uniref:Uncharacterized protein n=1 Tax=Phytophthora megakarya TaxID=4795 RepID=A0A225V930_9STRA|nr:hypothetical protein PHMEG_00026724 [Phytophthora megakarya]